MQRDRNSNPRSEDTRGATQVSSQKVTFVYLHAARTMLRLIKWNIIILFLKLLIMENLKNKSRKTIMNCHVPITQPQNDQTLCNLVSPQPMLTSLCIILKQIPDIVSSTTNVST